MSFHRFVYYNAVIAGWGGLAAWALAEGVVGDRVGGAFSTVVVGFLIGSMIAVCIGLVSNFAVAGLAVGAWPRDLRQLATSALVGGVGGVLGAGLGQLLYVHAGLPRAVGWAVLGLAVGAAEGFVERSRAKLRNGLIGGGLGGLTGGGLFDLLAAPGADMGARAVAFVLLGVAIGVFVGLAQVVLREAWLTVLDGFRPGRQLILSAETTLLGRGDHLPLPLLGPTSGELEAEHARIERKADGSFVIDDLDSRLGTLVNRRPIEGTTPLEDGDLVRLGGNILRFNVRSATPQRGAAGALPQAPTTSQPPLVPKTQSPQHGGFQPPQLPGRPSPGGGPGPVPPRPGPSSGGPRIPPPPPPPK